MKQKKTPLIKWSPGHPPAGRTPWRSVLPRWSAERSRARAAGSPKWVAGGTPPRSPTGSGCWRSPSASPGWAPSRTVRSGPWTLGRCSNVSNVVSNRWGKQNKKNRRELTVLWKSSMVNSVKPSLTRSGLLLAATALSLTRQKSRHCYTR